MEIGELYETANQLFECHVDGTRWFDLTEEIRKGALAVGKIDVESRLGICDSSDPRFIRAILEQALFLASSPDQAGKKLVRESIEGIGSRTWQFDEKAEMEFSPRALRLIEAMERESFSASLSRG